MRERGLKRAYCLSMHPDKGVAPHAGAWVETGVVAHGVQLLRVAPHAGAWVETPRSESPAGGCRVAPHAGAWVETHN